VIISVARVHANVTPLCRLPYRPSTFVPSTHAPQRRGIHATGQSRVGDFLRPGNDAIQSLEKSASKLLICNKLNFRACGLQDFDAKQGERIWARREWNVTLNGRPCRVVKSAGFLINPRKHSAPRNKKGQPRGVGLYELVEGWQRASNLVYQRVMGGANCCGRVRAWPVCRVIATDDKQVFFTNWIAVSSSQLFHRHRPDPHQAPSPPQDHDPAVR
jgi:hypothetical protein